MTLLSSNTRVSILRLIALSLGLAVLYLVYSGNNFDYSVLILIALILVMIIPNRSPKVFLQDWWYFAVMIFFYTMVRGLADDIGFRPQLQSFIAIDSWLFGGTLASTWLQQQWHAIGILRWYDHLLFYFYSSFFIFPFVTAYILWLKSRLYYFQFVMGFVLINIVALLFFVFLPVTPPWLAGEQGHLPVTQVLREFANTNGPEHISVSLLSKLFVTSAHGNIVAAFPSLHSAWPLFASLMLIAVFGRKLAWTLIIPAGIWFSVLYFGEHYLVDILAGIVLAVACFYLVWYKIFPVREKSVIV